MIEVGRLIIMVEVGRLIIMVEVGTIDHNGWSRYGWS